MKKVDDEYRKKLTIDQYRILREKATEMAFSGKYYDHFEQGCYRCAACGNLLFLSTEKFASPCGWPSFSYARQGSTMLVPDNSMGMMRTEVLCANCSSHLGHLFPDITSKSGQRYCINSLALNFSEKCSL